MATYEVSATQQLVDALAIAGAEDLVLAAAGTYVLADGVSVVATLRGAGRGQTIIRRTISGSGTVLLLGDGGQVEDLSVEALGTPADECYAIFTNPIGGTMAMRRLAVVSTTDGIGAIMGVGLDVEIDDVEVTTQWQALAIAAGGTFAISNSRFNVADGPCSGSSLTAIILLAGAGSVTFQNCRATGASQNVQANGISMLAGTVAAEWSAFSGNGYVDGSPVKRDIIVNAPGSISVKSCTYRPDAVFGDLTVLPPDLAAAVLNAGPMCSRTIRGAR